MLIGKVIPETVEKTGGPRVFVNRAINALKRPKSYSSQRSHPS